jgi:transposase
MTIKIKRLDHHGIVADVIDDLNMVSLLDKHLPQDDKKEITHSEAIKGMLMNGLRFSNRPLSLGPQFLPTFLWSIYFAKKITLNFYRN